MCISTRPAPALTTTGSIATSAPPETSFTIVAPAVRASVATAAWRVSTLTATSRRAPPPGGGGGPPRRGAVPPPPRAAPPRAAAPPDRGHPPPPLSRGGNRLGAGARGPPADVDDVRAFVSEPGTVRDGACRVVE